MAKFILSNQKNFKKHEYILENKKNIETLNIKHKKLRNINYFLASWSILTTIIILWLIFKN